MFSATAHALLSFLLRLACRIDLSPFFSQKVLAKRWVNNQKNLSKQSWQKHGLIKLILAGIIWVRLFRCIEALPDQMGSYQIALIDPKLIVALVRDFWSCLGKIVRAVRLVRVANAEILPSIANLWSPFGTYLSSLSAQSYLVFRNG